MRNPPLSNKKLFKLMDLLVIVIGLFCILFVSYRLEYVLRYDWNWSPVFDYFVFYSPEEGYKQNILLDGLIATFRIFIYASIFSLVIGLLLALMRVSSFGWVRILTRMFVELIRNMPPLVFLFIFYFFISDVLFPIIGIRAFSEMLSRSDSSIVYFFFGNPSLIENTIAGVVCLSLFEAAYVSEIIRAGIESVGKDQRESAISIGLTNAQVMRYVILPQAIRKVIPPLVGQIITLIKDTSIMSIISIQELTFMANEVVISSGLIFETWIIVALIYFVICFVISVASRKLEFSLAQIR